MRDVYRMADEIVGAALQAVREDDLLIVTSDHGQIGVRTSGFGVNKWLEENGYKGRAASFGESTIWINLKGRQKAGSVSPSEYESLRTEIMAKLEAERDLVSGERIMEMVLRREDCAPFGLTGEQVGDIVFFLKTEHVESCRTKDGLQRDMERGIYEHCSGEHHGYFPSACRGVGSIRAASFFRGTGVKKGNRLTRPIRLVDLAPTIVHVLEIPPLPRAEGRVLHELWA